MNPIYREPLGFVNSGGSQNRPGLSDREEGDIASISPTRDRSKMGDYDGPPNSQNLTVRGINRVSSSSSFPLEQNSNVQSDLVGRIAEAASSSLRTEWYEEIVSCAHNDFEITSDFSDIEHLEDCFKEPDEEGHTSEASPAISSSEESSLSKPPKKYKTTEERRVADRERKRKWREENPEAIREYNRLWHAEHREERRVSDRANHKKWYQNLTKEQKAVFNAKKYENQRKRRAAKKLAEQGEQRSLFQW
jgi:hypothetical protein